MEVESRETKIGSGATVEGDRVLYTENNVLWEFTVTVLLSICDVKNLELRQQTECGKGWQMYASLPIKFRLQN